MLYELETATELSGGSWYKNGEIDAPLQLRSYHGVDVSPTSTDPAAQSILRTFLTETVLPSSVIHKLFFIVTYY